VNTENLRTDEVAAYSEYTVSQNDSALACYNFDMHQPILIIFGRNVEKKVSSQIYFIFPPHITIASALPGEKKPEIDSFHLDAECVLPTDTENTFILSLCHS